MGQVTALGQVHAQHRVAQVQQGEVDRQIRLRPGVGLHVGVFRAEEFAGAGDGDALNLVDELAAAVVPLAGEPLGIFVGQHAAHGGHDRRGDDVFAGNQLDILPLAHQLPLHGGGNLRVDGPNQADGVLHILIHRKVPPAFIYYCKNYSRDSWARQAMDATKAAEILLGIL